MSVPHWEILRGSVQGPAKVRNQDWYETDAPADGTLVLAVADGHGSAAYTRSHLGARFAVDVFIRCGRAFAERARAPEDLRRLRHAAGHWLPREIVRDWQEEVRRHLGAYPPADASDDSADHSAAFRPYGTTLLGAVLVPGLFAAWQLGDGDLMVVEADGSIGAPLAPAEPELGDETESLCAPRAWELMRVHWAPVADPDRMPRCVTLSTDGLSKSFAAQEGFIQFVRELGERLDTTGAEAIREALPGWLAHAGGYSGDDTTVVAAWRPPTAGERESGDEGADPRERLRQEPAPPHAAPPESAQPQDAPHHRETEN
ncbi:PP2C family serine/threonine-protein phosphatase [Streptomyces syringium]|uniref:PP2C family serine/threonine-protein phosphatase n=1 Tax=Streptomyces syringium TaxID=76729 RepID=UPI0033DCB2F3